MDKRTLFSIFAFTIVLMFVNMYFDQQRQDQLREDRAREKVQNLQRVSELETAMRTKKATRDQLPLVEVDGIEALRFGDSLLTLSSDQTPTSVTIGGEALNQVYAAKGVDTLTVFGGEDLRVGNLPTFGKYDLQLVSFNPLQITYALYDDGQLVIPQQEINELRGESFTHPNALVLMKREGLWMPVATWSQGIPSLQFLDYIPELSTSAAPASNDKELFYVLEDATQQLVFSSFGAALAEINLPFQTDENETSVVHEIEYDRLMVEDHPANAHFPGHPTRSPDGKEHPPGPVGGYYPLLRRDLIHEGSIHKSIRVHPRYYALNIVSEYPEVAELIYEVKEYDKQHIVFEGQLGSRKIRKTFSLSPAPYCLDVKIEVDGDTRGLWVSSGVPEVEMISSSPAPVIKLRQTNGKVLAPSLPKGTTVVANEQPDWIVNSNGFFGTILDPLKTTDAGYRTQFVPGNELPSRLVTFDPTSSEKYPGYLTQLPLPIRGGQAAFRIYAGPFATTTLQEVDAMFTNPTTGETPDYTAARSNHGWFSFISVPFAKFLFILMRLFHYVTGSWGFSIILLTVALRIMLYPLNAWSMKSMAKMQQIAPKQKAIQEKFKKDPQKGQLEVMNLYREAGVNPMSSCFPMLIQMPFLFGMFDLLKSSFELRGAPFIPGWIDDLAAPDVLFTWDTPIWFIGNSFHLLPILLGVVMFFQSRLMSPAKNVNEMTEQQRQQKAMSMMLPLLFAFMFYNFPSGLNLYWMSSMLLGVAQQWWTQKQMGPNASLGQVPPLA